MKKIIFTILFVAMPFLCVKLAAQTTPTQDTTTLKPIYTKKQIDSIVKVFSDSLKKVSKAAAEKAGVKQSYSPKETASLVIVIAFFLVMILLLYKFFSYLKDKDQWIGYQSIKLIGLILIFPGVCILALIGGEDILSGETLAVLLGTIAGYVLSREDDSKDNNVHQAAKKKEEESQAKIKVLEETIKTIKEKNPNLIT